MFSDKRLPVILLAVPLLLVGLFAVQSLSLEFESNKVLSIQQRQAAMLRSHSSIIHALTENAQNASQTIRASIDSYTLRNTRNMAASDSLLFYFIRQDGERLFPPTETTALLIPEQHFLESLQGDIVAALKQLEGAGSYFDQITLPHHEESTTFYCDDDDLRTQICVLMTFESVAKTITRVLDRLSTQGVSPEISLSPPLSTSGEPKPKYFAQNLSPPLHHFTVYIDSSSALSAVSTFTLYAIIGLPLLACWVLISVIFNRSQNQKIEKAKSRTKLAAHLAHDLRTPLANLKLYGELLGRNSNKPESIQRYATIILQELSSLQRLSERTIQTAYGEPSVQTLDKLIPLEFIKHCVAQKNALIDSSGCEIFVSGGAKLPVYTDSLSLESILIQLVENAIKHSQSKRIDISVDLQGNAIHLQVRDFGSGICEQDQRQIFNPGFRASRHNEPGFGLGLSGIRHLAQLNGGDIDFYNASPGSLFLVKLPTEIC